MKKVLGILTLLIVVCAFTAWQSEHFLTSYNLQNLTRLTGLFGVLGIGVAFVIITGGIDLSIGSVIALTGSLLPYLLVKQGWSVPAALAAVSLMSAGIGLAHGLLVAKMNLQPFVVTLCGLLLYRGAARWLTADETQGFGAGYDGLKWLASGTVPLPGTGGFEIPVPLLIMCGLGVLAAVLLNLTLFGRYLLAIGRNEQAARFSGIRTDRIVIAAYVICSLCAGLGGMLFALEVRSVQPAGMGNFYELYAIAAAVLGGCALRGGEGSILGVVIGTALMRVLQNAISLLGYPSQLEFAIIGVVILLGVLTDEIVRRLAAYRHTRYQTRQSAD